MCMLNHYTQTAPHFHKIFLHVLSSVSLSTAILVIHPIPTSCFFLHNSFVRNNASHSTGMKKMRRVLKQLVERHSIPCLIIVHIYLHIRLMTKTSLFRDKLSETGIPGCKGLKLICSPLSCQFCLHIFGP